LPVTVQVTARNNAPVGVIKVVDEKKEEIEWINVTDGSCSIKNNHLLELIAKDSFDEDDDIITYKWSVIETPEEDSYIYNDKLNKETFNFTPIRLSGNYKIELKAYDGTSYSKPVTVQVLSENNPPVAQFEGTINNEDFKKFNRIESFPTVTGFFTDIDIDVGAQSSNDISYSWYIQYEDDDNPLLQLEEDYDSDEEVSKFISYTPNKSGKYKIALVVSDNSDNSQEIVIEAEAKNNLTVAKIVNFDEKISYTAFEVTCDGSESYDVDQNPQNKGDTPLIYKWEITSCPDNSNIENILTQAMLKKAKFKADQVGEYEITLTVEDEEGQISTVSKLSMVGWKNRWGMTFSEIKAGDFTVEKRYQLHCVFDDRYWAFEHCLTGNIYDDKQEPADPPIDSDFYMQTTEITHKHWKDIMGNDSSIILGKNFNQSSPDDLNNLPVYMLTIDEAMTFKDKINSILTDEERAQGQYDLPTENEWEYAARAGSSTAYAKTAEYEEDITYNDTDKFGTIAWYVDNSVLPKYTDGRGPRSVHPVGEKLANAWGLYDMHGNVWEWTSTLARMIELNGIHPTFRKTLPIYRGGASGEEIKKSSAIVRLPFYVIIKPGDLDTHYDKTWLFPEEQLGFRICWRPTPQ
jgi:formylglycine-generating enzyme required for sulfatase activity